MRASDELPAHPYNNGHLAGWLTKADAAARLQISERTLDRLVVEGKAPERQMRQREGRKPEPVFNPRDVDAFEQAARKPMLLAADSPLLPAGPAQDGVPPQLRAVLDLIAQLAAIAHRPAELPAAVAKLYLSIPEASEYTGLSERYLRRLVRAGALPAIRDGRTKVRRGDLDNIDSVARLAK